MGDENVTEMKEVRFYNILGFWDWEWEREGEKQNTREILVLWLFEGFFSFKFSDVERLAGKMKGIFGIKIHLSWKCMILQIFSNYIINFEICKIGFSKQYYYHIGTWKHNFPWKHSNEERNPGKRFVFCRQCNPSGHRHHVKARICFLKACRNGWNQQIMTHVKGRKHSLSLLWVWLIFFTQHRYADVA